MSHTLIGLWGTGLIAVMLSLSAVEQYRRGSLSRALTPAVAFIAALLISAVYTLPALAEKDLVRTGLMIARPNNLPENNAVPWLALFTPISVFTIGPLLVCAMAVVSLGWWVRRKPQPALLAWLCGALALTAITLPWASWLWAAKLIPFGSYMQYPCRLLSPAALCAAVAVGLGWAYAIPAPRTAAIACVPLLLGATVLAVPHFDVTPMPSERVYVSSERIRQQWIRATSLDEYMPREAVHESETPAARVVTSTADAQVRSDRSEGTRHLIAFDALRATELELNLHAFPGWQVSTEEGKPVRLGTSKRGLVSLQVPAAGHFAVTVSFGSTPLRRSAWALCLLGLLGVWPAAFGTARRWESA